MRSESRGVAEELRGRARRRGPGSPRRRRAAGGLSLGRRRFARPDVRWPRGRAASACKTFSIGFAETPPSTSSPGAPGRRPLRHRPPGADGRGPMPSSCCRRWSRHSTNHSATLGTPDLLRLPVGGATPSRWSSPARAATSSSAATTPTSRIGWRRGLGRRPRSCCRWSSCSPSSSGTVSFDQGQALLARGPPPAG